MTYENIVECEACGEQFDPATEPQEVKEGGIYICAPCWEKEE